MILSVFLLFYFDCRSTVLIESIYKDIEKYSMDRKEEEILYNKLKNVGIYSFHSNRKSSILTDLLSMNNNDEVLPLLDGNEMFFMRNVAVMRKEKNKHNFSQKCNWENYLNNKNKKPIRRINKISEIKTCTDDEILNFDKDMLKKENCKGIAPEDLYKSGYSFHKDKELLIVVSNLELDMDIFLIILKTIKTYGDSNKNSSEGFVNFIVFNFKDFASKVKFYKIISTFYKNLLDKENDNIYIKSPFIIAEFQEKRNKFSDSTIPDFKIRSMFEKDKKCEKFHMLKESLEVTHFKRENDHVVFKKPGIIVRLSENVLDDKNTKECSISSRVLNSSIKIICEFEDKNLYFRLNNCRVYQRFSKLSILCNDRLIQEKKFKSFYDQSQENKNLEILENMFISKNETDEIIPTIKIYEKLRDNIFLFLKPGFGLFYEDVYEKYNFINSDFVFINSLSRKFSFRVQEGSVMTNYKDILYNLLLALIPKLSERYEIFYFDYIEDDKNNTIEGFFFPYIRLSGEFSNVFSFRKRKIEDFYLNKKIQNIDEILILIENVKEIENSIYIHLNVRKVIYEFFKKSYENIFNKKIEELKRNSFYITQLKLTKSYKRNLKSDLLKIFEIHIDSIEKCKDAFSFKEIIFKNLKNIRRTRSYLTKISKALESELYLDERNYLEVLACYIFNINKHIKQEIFFYLRRIDQKVYFELKMFTSGYYFFKDFEFLEKEIEKKIRKKYDEKCNVSF